MAIQTRQEYYDYCVSNGLPLPELVRMGDVAFLDASSNKIQVRDIDVNVNDIRDIDDTTGEVGPWRRPALSVEKINVDAAVAAATQEVNSAKG